VRILIIQTAFLGDVILATALVESLYTAYPDAELHMLVRRGNEGVLEGHPHLKQVWVWDKRYKYKDLFRLIREVRKAEFNAIVCVQRFAAMGLLTALSGAKIRSGFAKNPFSSFFTHKADHHISAKGVDHEVDRNQALLSPFPKATVALPFLSPTPAALTEALPYQANPYVCIAPATVWATKQLPTATWAKLINLLVAQDPSRSIYLIGGPSDAELAKGILEMANEAPGQVQNLCGKLSLMGSAALLQRAERLYANDSGPVHIASAVRCATTAVYCSTVPSFGFGPLAPGSAVVQETVGLPCRPCGLHGHKLCPQTHFLCGKIITPQAVLHITR
jgi:heptosyltransferase-2